MTRDESFLEVAPETGAPEPGGSSATEIPADSTTTTPSSNADGDRPAGDATAHAGEQVATRGLDRSPGRSRRPRWPSWRRDLAVSALFLLTAIWVTARIWVDPAGRVPTLYRGDPAQVQFFLAHSVRVVLDGEFPFYTRQLNYPDGVNLMANTAILGLGIPMVPVTLLFGPAVAFVMLVTLGLAGTALAWYFVLSRHLVGTPAAIVGGWFCGFSPAMLSHANWHPNIISQFLLPFIVWRVIVLTRSTRVIRDGALLGALVVYQAFINEEILLFTALACAVFLLAVLVQQPGRWRTAWRPLSGGLGVCAAIAAPLLAYPLYVQFAGPQAYHGLNDTVRDYGNDVAAFFSPGSATLGGSESANADLAPNYSEENAFFGWGLSLLTVGVVLWLRRDMIVRALAFTGASFAVLSLGERVSYWQHDIVVGPWELLNGLPLLDAVVPTRFAMITTVVIGLLLAIGTDRALSVDLGDRRVPRAMVAAALAIALVPLAPMPLRESHRPDVPRFITSGLWQPYVAEDQTLVPVPVPDMGNTHGMRWAAATDLGFKIPGGYFLAPRSGITGDRGRFGGRPTGLAAMLDDVASTGRVIDMNDRQRRRALDELRHWRAAIMVLPVREHNAAALRATVDQLVGPGRRVSDVWIWDVRPTTTIPS